MEKNLVTIVVPIYNVEAYLHECVDSILGQSYSNLEIILVDDGSLDSSGKICDFYSTQDNRIKVIHKLNGGLSSARNSGIEIANGDFIAFVDSDDYIHPKMIERMVDLACLYNASIICCDYTSTEFTDKKIVSKVLDNRRAICRLFDDNGFKCFAWNKIYRRNLFKDILYPQGKLYEDIQTTYKLFKMVDKIIYTKDDLYYYRIRENSISRYKFSERDRDLLEAINNVMNDSNSLGIASGNLKIGYMGYYLWYIKKGMAAGANITDSYYELSRFVKDNYLNLFIHKNISLKKRSQLFLVGFCPKIYKYIYESMLD